MNIQIPKFNNLKKIKSFTPFKCKFCGHLSICVRTSSKSEIRNDHYCIFCKSTSRNRHLLKVILDLFEKKSIHDLNHYFVKSNIKVYNTGSEGVIARKLKNIINSSYYDGVNSGQFVNGVLCQDITKTSFESNEFDLVITEDVLEHIPEYQKAFKEIYRILKPGGRHIFTIPFYFDRKTNLRFEYVDQEIKLFEPVEYHLDSIRGKIPCYIHYGYTLFDEINQFGYSTLEVKISKFRDSEKNLTYDCYTFIATKK